ncbi:MAG: hypothetical protein ABEK16_01875 [Candidatus Nanohalobium sp.]
MNLSFEDEVHGDLDKVKEEVEKEILSEVFGLMKDPLPENSYVIHLPDGTEIQCLKLQEEDRNSELNHRVTYDIENNEIKVYGIFPRGPGYQNIKQETENRRD